MTFECLGLGPDVLRAIADSGYTTPTPIQEKAIPYVLQGRDVLGCAQTGTGKTASFSLPMVEIMQNGRSKARMPRSLIIEPTRELAAQVAENFEKYGKYSRLSAALLIGGESFTEQEKLLTRGVDVLIVTPGRMIDLFERGRLMLSDVRILVIDEADRMLDMGFMPDVEKIVGLLPPMRQTLFFSATMPPEIRRLADKFLQNPKEISVAPPASPAATVRQRIARVSPRDKRDALRRLVESEEVGNAFVFCNRKRDIGVLTRSLSRHGFSAAELHGDLAQSKRTETLERFKQGDIKLLVCSDVAARGIDVDDLSHVFNFDVPNHAEDYVHRIGRTGRAGRNGVAITLATAEDSKALAAISKLVGKEIEPIQIPGLAAPEEQPVAEEDNGRRRRRSRGRGRSGEAGDDESATNSPGRSGDDVGGSERGSSEDRVASNRASSGGGPSDRGRRGRRRDHRDDVDSEPVIGLGDHVPAFLLRPTPLSPVKGSSGEDKEAA